MIADFLAHFTNFQILQVWLGKMLDCIVELVTRDFSFE